MVNDRQARQRTGGNSRQSGTRGFEYDAMKRNPIGSYNEEMDLEADHKDLASYDARITTYNSYRGNHNITARALCEAGFFYEGHGKVRCFFCDGALEHWGPYDEPWVEHAKFYPGCKHVWNEKGKEFVKYHRARMTKREREIASQLNYSEGDTKFLNN